MKIAFFHNGILPVSGYGGIERILFWHMVDLAKLGHQVVLVGHPESKVESFGIQLIPLQYEGDDWVKQVPKDTDIIHMSFRCKLDTTIPIITTIHGNGQIGEVFDKNTVFVSKKHADVHGSNQFVHNALDLEEYPYRPKAKREWNNFLFLAKASWRVKNLKDTVRAARSGHRHLHVAGGRWWGLSRFVHNHGIIGGDEKMKIIRSCDFMAFPVRWHEPFGIAVIEAMSQGLPVIGSPYGSLPELINKDVGFIAKDYEELARLIKEDHSKTFNPDTIRKYVEENFNVRKHALSYLELYKKVISGESLNETPPTYRFTERAENLLAF